MTQKKTGRVLVVGMGISGIATAIRLHAAGWTPVIIERSAGRRRGGYFMILFSAGRVAAERLGLLDHLHDRRSSLPNYAIDRAGRKEPMIGGLPGNPWLMLRGDVEQAAHAVLPDDIEIRYSTVPTAIAQDDDEVEVTLLNTAEQTSVTERFDLVVGSDGLRSTVRRLVFGPDENYLHRLNFMIAAYQYTGSLSGLQPGASANLLEPNRSMLVFAFADHDPTILLSYRTDDVDAEFTQSPAERVRAAYGPKAFGATLGDAIDALDTADGVLFDSAERVHMDTWHKGRVVLVGDSAWCATLYSGTGVTAGLVGADLLGAMVEHHPGDIDTALESWEQALRPHIECYQKMGRDQRKLFVADNRVQIGVRRLLLKLGKIPLGERLLSKLFNTPGSFVSTDIVATALAALPTPLRHDEQATT